MLRHLGRLVVQRQPNSCRWISSSGPRLSDKLEPSQTPKTPHDSNDISSIRRTYIPSKLERKILIWTGKYKTDAEIPNEVPVETIELARNRARIKFANYMIVATVISCFFVALSGKRAAKRGESVAKMNEDWHKEMNAKSN